MYASDVTRTFPVNGTFSEPQRELYDVVLEAQSARRRKAAQAGNHWNEPHDAAVGEITQRPQGPRPAQRPRAASSIKSQAYRQFFMHSTGHWLGLDVHDVGDYKVARPVAAARARHGHDDRARHLRLAREQGRRRSAGAASASGSRTTCTSTRDGPEVLTAGVPTTGRGDRAAHGRARVSASAAKRRSTATC